MKSLIVCMLVLLLFIPLFSPPAQAMDRYDRWFSDYTTLQFGNAVQPAWPKAVAMAESGLKFTARSDVGAEGLLQIMPSTWASVAPDPWKSRGPFDPEAAIFVGVKYLRWQWSQQPRSGPSDRKALSNAAYNSGLGWILKAQKRCALEPGCNPLVWDTPNVETHLLTSIQAQAETRGYVKRIRGFEIRLQAGSV